MSIFFFSIIRFNVLMNYLFSLLTVFCFGFFFLRLKLKSHFNPNFFHCVDIFFILRNSPFLKN